MKKDKKKAAQSAATLRAALPGRNARGGDLCHDRRYYITVAAGMQEGVGS